MEAEVGRVFFRKFCQMVFSRTLVFGLVLSLMIFFVEPSVVFAKNLKNSPKKSALHKVASQKITIKKNRFRKAKSSKTKAHTSSTLPRKQLSPSALRVAGYFKRKPAQADNHSR